LDIAERYGCTYRSNLSVTDGSAPGSHLELLILDVLAVCILEEIQMFMPCGLADRIEAASKEMRQYRLIEVDL